MRKDFGFTFILKEQKARYPLMEPQDYGKLIFQGEFGAEHMVTDRQAVRSYLLEEWENLPQDSAPRFPEPIGDTLCRFPLSACPSAKAAELLAELFILTAQANAEEAAESHKPGEAAESHKPEDTVESGIHRGSIAEKIKQLAELGVPGMEEWMAAWKEKGYPAVHHSRTYNQAYHPHYRLLRTEYAACFPALVRIAALMEKGEPVIVGIDGRCGSGKTGFASLAARLFPCNVLHMDDFYMPFAKREENWEEIPGGNMDFERFLSEALLPARNGKCVHYRPYDCGKEAQGETRLLPFSRLTIVEGSYSHHPLLAKYYNLKIFLTCSAQEQARRLQAREGSHYHTFEEKWIPMEEKYFQHFAVETHSDLTVETGELL